MNDGVINNEVGNEMGGIDSASWDVMQDELFSNLNLYAKGLSVDGLNKLVEVAQLMAELEAEWVPMDGIGEEAEQGVASEQTGGNNSMWDFWGILSWEPTENAKNLDVDRALRQSGI